MLWRYCENPNEAAHADVYFGLNKDIFLVSLWGYADASSLFFLLRLLTHEWHHLKMSASNGHVLEILHKEINCVWWLKNWDCMSKDNNETVTLFHCKGRGFFFFLDHIWIQVSLLYLHFCIHMVFQEIPSEVEVKYRLYQCHMKLKENSDALQVVMHFFYSAQIFFFFF